MKAAAILAAAVPAATLAAAKDLDALGRMLAVDAWTDRTRRALTTAAGKPQRLLTLALVSPEYAVS
jgi:hypothetical protein